MVIQLASGKVIEISIKQYLDMSDEEFNEEMADVNSYGHGVVVEDAFFRSSLTNKFDDTVKKTKDEDEEDNEIEPALYELNAAQKLIELDIDMDAFIEE